MTWLIFDGWVEGDEALDVSTWIAANTARLGGLGNDRVLRAERATRSGVEAALATAAGMVIHAHGSNVDIRGTDGAPALDFDNAGVVTGRWVYAASCRTGVELAQRWADASASPVVAFVAAVRYEWLPSELAEEITQPFAALLAHYPLKLAEGVADWPALRRSLADEIDRFSVAAGALADGVQITLQQLLDSTVWLEKGPVA